MVELPLLGRKGTLAISTSELGLILTRPTSHQPTFLPVLTGIFLSASTTARSSDALLGWICGYSFASNVMYGVLYAISPEVFPTKDRGTGNALVAAANRVFGIIASIIARCTPISRLQSRFISPERCSSFLDSSLFCCRSNLEEGHHFNDTKFADWDEFYPFSPYLTRV